jgi:hypothetical protein
MDYLSKTLHTEVEIISTFSAKAFQNIIQSKFWGGVLQPVLRK